MRFPRYELLKRVLPIIAIVILLGACFLLIPRTPNGTGPSTIIDDVIPLSDRPEIVVDAEYYLFDPGEFEATFTNVTPDLAKYVGTGSFNYSEDLFNQVDSVWTNVKSEPDYQAPNGQYIEWGTVYRYDGKYIVVGTYKTGEKPAFSNDISNQTEIVSTEDDPAAINVNDPSATSFDTINELVGVDLPIGTTVKTRGYKSVGDNGGATYTITDKPDYKADNIFVIRIKNNKYAQLKFDPNGYINVACAGIQPNEPLSSKLNSLMYYCNNRIKGIAFNSGTYNIDSAIHLYDLALKGTGSTDLKVAHDYTGSGGTIIHCSNSFCNVSFEGINFIYNTDSSHPLANRESIFISLGSTDNCVIKNCTFTATNSSPGTNIAIDMLWFNHASAVSNVTISNCTFNNLTGSSADDSMLRGGCIWMCGPSGTTDCNFSNINITKCKFNHTANDESIGFWNGQFSNVSINDCEIHLTDHGSNNILSFFKCGFHDVKITNTTFKTSALAKSAIKLEAINSPSSITVSGCRFAFDYPSADPYTQTQSIVLYTDDSSGSTITFDNNTVTTPSNTQYRSLFNCKNDANATITVSNNKVSCPLAYGLIYLNTCQNMNTDVRKNTVDNSSYIATTSGCLDSSLNVTGNTISSTNSILVRSASTLDYSLEGNTFNTNSNSFVTYSSSAQSTSDIRLTTD